MRRIRRRGLPNRAALFLARKQAELDATEESVQLDQFWRRVRQTKTMGMVADVLRDMARKRQRCMYCEDSRGTDIEHFWPKQPYRGRTFEWLNLLLVCTGCNRVKGDRFPLSHDGKPDLIDPTTEDPWDSLFFDAATGNVTARFGEDGAPRRKGRATTELLPLDHEPLTEGRLRCLRNIKRAVNTFLANDAQSADDAEGGRILAELTQALQDNDDYGLGQWYFLKDGQDSEPFSRLRAVRPDAWKQIQDIVRR